MLDSRAKASMRRAAHRLLLGLSVGWVTAVHGMARAQSAGGFPRLANIYLHGNVDPAAIPALARWDLVVLNSVWTETDLARLRARNPTIRILLYVLPYAVAWPEDPSDPWEQANIDYAQSNDLWWYDRNANPASDWPSSRMVNLTRLGAAGPQGTWSTYIANRIEALAASRAAIDGIMLDNFWERLSWNQTRLQLDSDCNPTHNPDGCDGTADANAALDSLWNGALRSLAADLRQRFDALEARRDRPLILVGNGVSDYFAWLNGSVHEAFPSGWSNVDPGNPYLYNWNFEILDPRSGYLAAPFSAVPYRASILNSVWTGTQAQPDRSDEFERHKRFTLVSTLLGDGYYSLDAGRQLGNGALWWEPEYDAAGRGKSYLGKPLGPMARLGVPSGPELVTNGGFLDGTAGWEWYGSQATGSVTIDAAILHSAPAALRIDVQSVSAPSGEFKLWKNGLALVAGRSYTLAFWARASRQQDLLLHLYADPCPGSICLGDRSVHVATQWQRHEIQFFAAGTADASLDVFVRETGTVWLDDVSLREGDTTIFRRDFERGAVLLNYTASPQSLPLGGAYQRLLVPGNPVFDGATVTTETVPPWDGRILLRLDAAPPGPRGELRQNEPNPFNPATRIGFRLHAPTAVRCAVYDTRGRLLRVLLDAPLLTGDDYAVTWDGTDRFGRPVGSGVYVYRLETPSFDASRKMTLVR